jgi:ACS family pantothenate transporter-like MFS transporter
MVDRNIIPTGTKLFPGFCIVLWGFLSDYTGSRFAFVFGPLAYGLKHNGILASWPPSQNAKLFAFFTCGVRLMTAILLVFVTDPNDFWLTHIIVSPGRMSSTQATMKGALLPSVA